MELFLDQAELEALVELLESKLDRSMELEGVLDAASDALVKLNPNNDWYPD